MIKGLSRWQVGIALLGGLGTVVLALGIVNRVNGISVAGLVTVFFSVLILLLLGIRQQALSSKKLYRTFQSSSGSARPAMDSVGDARLAQLPKVGVDHEYARLLQRDMKAYESYALRTPSLKIRDAFALAATKYYFNYADLARFVHTQRAGMLPGVKRSDLQNWNSDALLTLARLHANQQLTIYDLDTAAHLYSFIQAFFGSKTLSTKDQLTYIEVLGELKQFEKQSAFISRYKIDQKYPTHTVLLKLNALLSIAGSPDLEWVETLNDIYSEYGYSKIELQDTSHVSPLDQLRTRTEDKIDGPLVSIIVPSYKGGPHLITALRSLLNQSWQNVEIIVVDDGSPREFDQYLEQAANLSPKIRILKQEANRGPYSARNAGVKLATGEFITVHDDDDWSHGDKIATQIQHLINNPNVPGNMTSLVRSTDELRFLRINANPTLLQTNFSSLMVSTSALQEIGPWDEVNRGADSEFRDRLETYFGSRVEILADVPLSFTRTWQGSLTSGELSRGYVDPNRTLYSKSYKQWHRKVGSAVHLLRPSNPRNFPVPTNMMPEKRREPLGSIDFVFMADFRATEDEATITTISDIKHMAAMGHKVGFIHSPSPLLSDELEISAALLELQLNGTVVQVSLRDSADIDSLVVRTPSSVTFMDSIYSSLTVREIVLDLFHAPIFAGGEGSTYDLWLSRYNLERTFSAPVSITSRNPEITELCKRLSSTSRFGGGRLYEILRRE